MQLCTGCKTFRDIVITDELERPFCAECASFFPETQAALLLAWLHSGIPYDVGDKVSCKSGGVVYDGIGHVTEVSYSPEQLASPVVPMFRVVMDEKAYPEMPDEMWYPEILLEKVEDLDG